MNRRYILTALVIVGLFVPLALMMLMPSFSLVELIVIVTIAATLLAGGWIAMRRMRTPSNPAPGPAPDVVEANEPASPPDAQAIVFRVGAALAILLIVSVAMGALYAAGGSQAEPAAPAATIEPATMARSVNPLGGIALPLIVGIAGGVVLIAVLAAVMRSGPDENRPAAEAEDQDQPGVDWNAMLRPDGDEEEDDGGIVDWWVSQLRKKDD
jgi:hypothetical protein